MRVIALLLLTSCVNGWINVHNIRVSIYINLLISIIDDDAPRSGFVK